MEVENKIVTGFKELKQKWTYCKIKSGDMRGLKSSRFAIAESLGITAYETMFHSIAPKSGKVEIEADIYEDDTFCGAVYNYKDLYNDLKTLTGNIEITFIKVQWNKTGTDADRSNIMTINFKP